jgi:hypothetical protein
MSRYLGKYTKFKGQGKVHTNGKADSTPIMFEWKRSDYEKILGILEPRVGRGKRMLIREVVDTAAYEAAKTARADTKKLLAEATTLKPAEIGKRIKVYKKGSPGTSMAIGMLISDTARPMSDFSFTPSGPKYRTAPTVEVYRGKETTLVKGAFVGRMPNNHIGVYQREEEKRKNYTAQGGYDMKSKEHIHINSLPAPSVTGLFKANKEMHKKVWEDMFNNFRSRVIEKMKSILEGKNG